MNHEMPISRRDAEKEAEKVMQEIVRIGKKALCEWWQRLPAARNLADEAAATLLALIDGAAASGFQEDESMIKAAEESLRKEGRGN